MKLLIISTINGIQNEGMRNVITNYSKSFEKRHKVEYATLSDLVTIFAKARACDAVIVCARANAKLFFLCKLLRLQTKKLYVLLVQKPESKFISLNNTFKLYCDYIAVYKNDAKDLKIHNGKNLYEVSVGINQRKFKAITSIERTRLKEKYGFGRLLPVVLHVGHCSRGRGLEELCSVDQSKFQRVVVASGLFEDKAVIEELQKEHVRIISGYLPNVEELYQMADVYLFPTKTSEFVISIPLSVMEALSCGTPVVAYRQLSSLSYIKTAEKKALRLIECSCELDEALGEAIFYKDEKSLLAESISWDESAQQILDILKGKTNE